jgi:ABC-type nitrate/sulfonate/bicarbonate transport system ATPase subunit
MLLDEPLGALDQFTRMRLQDEVLQLWRARRPTMVLVTHDIDEAIYMSDRIHIMSPRPGRIERVIEVSLERPRLRTSAPFMELRSSILKMLHLSGREDDQAKANGVENNGTPSVDGSTRRG